jgi:hypothetical protein
VLGISYPASISMMDQLFICKAEVKAPVGYIGTKGDSYPFSCELARVGPCTGLFA